MTAFNSDILKSGGKLLILSAAVLIAPLIHTYYEFLMYFKRESY